MNLPKTYRGCLKLLIAIAENGHPNDRNKKLTVEDEMNFGGLIADIQNNLSEMNETTLEKLKLHYDGGK